MLQFNLKHNTFLGTAEIISRAKSEQVKIWERRSYVYTYSLIKSQRCVSVRSCALGGSENLKNRQLSFCKPWLIIHSQLRWHRRDTNRSCPASNKIEKRDKKKKSAISKVERARFFLRKKEIFERNRFLFCQEHCATLKSNGLKMQKGAISQLIMFFFYIHNFFIFYFNFCNIFLIVLNRIYLNHYNIEYSATHKREISIL